MKSVRSRRTIVFVIALMASLAAAASATEETHLGPARDDAPVEGSGSPAFRDITSQAGILFVHRNGATGRRTIPESMGSGVAAIDYDGDGWQDLYFVDSGPLPPDAARPGGNRLYRNLGGGRFHDVTERARVPGRGYGMGAVVGDYDNDGDPDLYITGFGPNLLYRNEGDGTFADVTDRAAVDDPRWSTGAAFLDYDRDGHLDLFVQNYVDFTLDMHTRCYSAGTPIYCTPDSYEGTSSSLFRNRGDGTFEDVSAASGIGGLLGKGLGVCTADLDDDGWPDIYCANDTTRNFLFHNRSGKGFEEIGLISGVGYSEDGREDASMGVDAADMNGDGRLDLVVTNFQWETNSLYRNDGGLFFAEVSLLSGTAATALDRLGFGVRFLDFDDDGIQDLVIANGHVYDNGLELTPPAPHAQPPSLFRGLGGGRFEDATATAGPGFAEPVVARGLALADLDEDGDPDLILSANGGAARIFENLGGNGRSWVTIRLVGTRGDRTALGAQVRLDAADRSQVGEVRSGASYLSQSDLRLFFGVGDEDRLDALRIRWPGGSVQKVYDLPAGWHWILPEGVGPDPAP